MSGLSLQDNQARDYLLNVLNERDISLGSDDISWAFASDKTREELISWIKEYLQEHTLLTKDEAALFVTPIDLISANFHVQQSEHIKQHHLRARGRVGAPWHPAP